MNIAKYLILFFLSAWVAVGAKDVKDQSGDTNPKLFSEAGDLTASEIVKSHDVLQEVSRLSPELEVLGFVTPWHEKGKKLSVRAANVGKLDYVAPVSWQMHPSGLQGGEDFSDAYYDSIRVTGTKVYPRLLFENWSASDFKELAKQSNVNKMIKEIAGMCKVRGFDGIVFEIWQSLAASGALNKESAGEMMKMVRRIGEGIRLDSVHTALVLPPFVRDVKEWGVTSEGISDLSMGFSQFIVMTYDYSTLGSQPGPLAPVDWVESVARYLSEDCRLGGKLLLGINFYGIDFVDADEISKDKNRHIVGDEVVRLLEKHDPKMLWVREVGEHAFSYNDGEEKHIVFYPTRQSIRQRLKIAESVGCGGVAVWDIGQGLDHFFDAF